jgi:uncharacterized integral membrane protein (TIGR00698 family)
MSDDWLAVALGMGLLTASLAAVLFQHQTAESGSLADPAAAAATWSNPLAPWVGKPTAWSGRPLDSLGADATGSGARWLGGTFFITAGLFGLALFLQQGSVSRFLLGLVGLFGLSWLALVIAAHETIDYYQLEYALWALLVGLAISNTIGLPDWLRPAVRTELYIKTGLVLYGAKILISRLMELGPPGLAVAWVVTPVVLVTTYWFGQRVLGIESKTLNMVISADMSVCGVSAAIATAAACRAKKEELSLAVGISLAFTAVMMVVMPVVVKLLGLSPSVGGAWIGGTIDSTAAVLAAGQALGDRAAEVAITIKMIQNILIGVVAFSVACYWVRYVEQDAAAGEDSQRPGFGEVWHRFPKFVLGFLAASALFSLLYAQVAEGSAIIDATLKQGTEPLRSWFFCLAFVSIGLESDFRVLKRYLRGGKPLWLYVSGQSLNLTLTLLMAWLVFGD